MTAVLIGDLLLVTGVAILLMAAAYGRKRNRILSPEQDYKAWVKAVEKELVAMGPARRTHLLLRCADLNTHPRTTCYFQKPVAVLAIKGERSAQQVMDLFYQIERQHPYKSVVLPSRTHDEDSSATTTDSGISFGQIILDNAAHHFNTPFPNDRKPSQAPPEGSFNPIPTPTPPSLILVDDPSVVEPQAAEQWRKELQEYAAQFRSAPK